MGQARIPTHAVQADTLTATTDGGDHLTVNLYHIDRYNDPSQRIYWIEHILRPAPGKPKYWRHTRQYTGTKARTSVTTEWQEIRQAIEERNA